jgi:hypothetical protein
VYLISVIYEFLVDKQEVIGVVFFNLHRFHVAVSFIGGGNGNVRRKALTCRK